jgi:endonuclease III
MTETEFRLSEVAKRLVKRYGRRAPKPNAKRDDPLEELMYTILSQQNVGVVTQRLYDALKKAFPTWKQALEAGSDGIQRVLEAAGGGLAAVKAKSIHRCLGQILEAHGELSLEFLRRESLEDARDFLESLPGVGPKTSGCVHVFHTPYVRRVGRKTKTSRCVHVFHTPYRLRLRRERRRFEVDAARVPGWGVEVAGSASVRAWLEYAGARVHPRGVRWIGGREAKSPRDAGSVSRG